MKSSINFATKKYILLFMMAMLMLSSCTKEEGYTFEGDEKSRVFFNIGNNTFNGYNKINFSVIQFNSGPSGADIKAAFPARMTQETTEDVKVTYGVDNSMIAKYNTTNGTSYVAVPDGIVALGSELIIPRGELLSSSNIDFSIPRDKMGQLTSPGYLIPIKIISVSGANAEVSSNSSTVYVVITATVTNEFERTNWSIHSFSSQESTGEGANNGRAIYLIDNVLNTFWTSQWQAAEPSPPHWVAFNMGTTQNMSGLYITGRQVSTSSGPPKVITVDVSTNGTTWQNVGTFDMALVQTKQTLAFSQKYSAQYFKITVTTIWGTSKSTFLAEVSAY